MVGCGSDIGFEMVERVAVSDRSALAHELFAPNQGGELIRFRKARDDISACVKKQLRRDRMRGIKRCILPRNRLRREALMSKIRVKVQMLEKILRTPVFGNDGAEGEAKDWRAVRSVSNASCVGWNFCTIISHVMLQFQFETYLMPYYPNECLANHLK